MASRVEKYYDKQDYDIKRSQKNQVLYDAISELDKITADELARLHNLFDTYEKRKTKQDIALKSSFISSKSREKMYEKIYEDLEKIKYNKNIDKKENKYSKGVEEKDEQKIRELIHTITTHLDILEKQESHLENLKDLAYYPEQIHYQKQSVDSSLHNKKREEVSVQSLFDKNKSLFSPKKKIFSFFSKHEDASDEKSFYLRVKKGVLIAFIINSIFILFFIYRFIR